jgi:uncharacterized membrane protein YbhN (UPF0104 family)
MTGPTRTTERRPAKPQQPAAGIKPAPRAAGRTPGDPHTPGRRKIVVTVVLIVLTLVGLYLLLPKLAGLNQTWGRLRRGDPWWLGAAAGVETLSIAGYIVLFHAVFARGMRRLDWRVSTQIPLAGIAAIRLFAAAGAGGVAVTVWALGRAGMEPRVIACRMVANLLLQYTVYVAALFLFGLGLGLGVLAGHGPFELTLLPALLSLVLAALALSAILVPSDVERRLQRISGGPRWWRAVIARLAAAPAALGEGSRTAVALIKQRRPGLLGAVMYWGFDIAALGLSFQAFGGSPTVAVIVMGYFLGTLGSLLPLPGGIGGVEGAMIGSFVVFGVPADQAVIVVLAYRAISFWLPTLPGIAGYFALRRSVHRWERLDAKHPPARAKAAIAQKG